MEPEGCVDGAARGPCYRPDACDLCFHALPCGGRKGAFAGGHGRDFCCDQEANLTLSDFSYASHTSPEVHLPPLGPQSPPGAVALWSRLCLYETLCCYLCYLCCDLDNHRGCHPGNTLASLGLAPHTCPSAASCFPPAVGCVIGRANAFLRGYLD